MQPRCVHAGALNKSAMAPCSGGSPPHAPPGGAGNGGGRTRLCATGGYGSEGPGGLGGLWDKYLQLLDSHPFLTRCITCGVLNGLGDVFSQVVIEGGDFNVSRALIFGTLGLTFAGPILFFWYGWLGSVVSGTGVSSVLASLALDQIAFAPAFIAAFMSVITAIDDQRSPQRSALSELHHKLGAKLVKDWVPAVQVNWLLWVPAQFINFKFVPANLRVLAVNVTALIWNVYMSFQSHKQVAHG